MINSVFYKDLQPAQLLEKIAKCPVAYLPIGTLEWHGRHMPLGTDMIIPETVFAKVAEKFGGVVLPPLFLAPDIQQKINGKKFAGMEICGFEKDKPNQLFGNCYHISDKLFYKILNGILENLKRNGFKYLVAHGHGPSMNAFSKYKAKFKKKYGIECFTLFDLGFSEKDGIQTDHAASNETSLVMSINSKLVDIEKLNEDEIPVAIWGKDPRTSASIEIGDKLISSNLEEVVSNLAKIIELQEESQLPKIKFSNIKSLIDK